METSDEPRKPGLLLYGLLLAAVVLLGLAHVQLERIVRREQRDGASGVVVEYTRTRGDDTLRAQVQLLEQDTEQDWITRLDRAMRGLEAFGEQR